MTPSWRDWPDECPACGSDVEVHTTAEPEDGHSAAHDDDDARCVSCGWRGSIVADEGEAYLSDGNLMKLCQDHNQERCRICLHGGLIP